MYTVFNSFSILVTKILGCSTNRLATPNKAVKRRIDKHGHEYFMCDPIKYKNNIDGIEVGIFASVLSTLALEKKIDVSYKKEKHYLRLLSGGSNINQDVISILNFSELSIRNLIYFIRDIFYFFKIALKTIKSRSEIT